MEEKLLFNGNVITMDDTQPKAEALVVRGERLAFIGNKEEALKNVRQECQRIDLKGMTVVPGFNDNHIHAVQVGDCPARPNLSGLDEEGIITLLKKEYGDSNPDVLMYAFGWDYSTCPNPHKSLLDAVFPSNPVILYQYSGHAVWVNTEALNKMGIKRNSPDPPNGEILRDPDGGLTGVIREPYSNGFLIRHYMKLQMNKSLNRECLRSALNKFKEYGITSIQDNTWFPTTVNNLAKLHKERELTCRFSCWSLGESPIARLFMALPRYNAQWYHRGLVKFSLDGAFSTHTAWLTEHYADEAGNSGKGKDGHEIRKRLIPVLKKKRQAGFHAIGDRSIKELLDVAEELDKEFSLVPELRLRLEHAQLIRPEDFSRIKRLGILVAVQPSALANRVQDISLLGRDRAARAYPYRSLLDEGIPLSFGTDAPAETTYNPLEVIHHAVNRDDAERITPEEALKCYTVGSAFAERCENEKGSIAAGKFADLAVLSENILEIKPDQIKNTTVKMTMVGGRIVHQG